MAKQPVYLGDHRILTWMDADTPVIADSRSMDSLDFVMGWGIEDYVMPLYRKLLHRKATVIDVGANFGAYTAQALRRVLPEGRLYAIEANPLVFDRLQWTIYANRGTNAPNVTAINAAAGAQSGGSLTLHYDPQFLGGGSIAPHPGLTAVEVPMIALDDLIPADVTPDIIKIDVEGSEPFVLQGAKKLLARSPDVVLVIEYFLGILDGTYGARRFLDDLHKEYGLTVWSTVGGGRLRRLGEGDYPSENCYLFASRRSLDEFDTATYCIYPEDLRYGSEHLFYGPYTPLSAGQYEVRVHGQVSAPLELLFQSDFGRTVHGTALVTPTNQRARMTVARDVEKFEILAAGPSDSLALERIDLIAL